MYLIPIPAFADNYLWLLHDGHRALVVDPGDAGPVQRVLEQNALQLESIFVTHHHADHTGGVDALRAAYGARVYGPAMERIPQPFEPLTEGDTAHALGMDFQVFDVPGHTAGHIAYFLASVPLTVCGIMGHASALVTSMLKPGPLLFCGDTLFSGGCGRLFEGTAAQMLASLDKLAALPGDTVVCCTHEYTLSNLRFAQAVEPGNVDLATYQLKCVDLRKYGIPTLPTSIALEQRINPFLRTRRATIVAAAQRFDASARDDTTVFAAIRQWKDEFK
jgi:hydroxyacylglutathione hydrolase